MFAYLIGIVIAFFISGIPGVLFANSIDAPWVGPLAAFVGGVSAASIYFATQK